MAHKWTEKEDEICVDAVFKEYVDKTPLNSFLEKMSKKMPQVPQKSIRAKIQNIKWLLDEHEIVNLVPITGLSKASQQGKDVFEKALNKRLQNKQGK